MKKYAKFLLTILIAFVGIGIASLLIATKPKADEKERERILPAVEVITVQPDEFVVKVNTQGEVLAQRETPIASEVAGRVLIVSPKFEVGERFGDGEALINIDTADYDAAEAAASAELANARLALQQEQAMAAQALRDWKALGQGREPTDLVLRKPQLASAEARLDAAQKALLKAERDVLRATVKAPYACQVVATRTEVGSFLNVGSPVAVVRSTAGLEVRLPVPLDDYAFLKDGPGSEVAFVAEFGGRTLNWKGKVLRTEGQVDRASRSIFVVAKISANEADQLAARFLAPGLFVRATITGETLQEVFRLPRKALYGKDGILIVSPENRLALRRVSVLRTEHDEVIIAGGLEAGERVAISPLPEVINNMEVSIASQEDADSPEETVEPEEVQK